MKSVVSFLQDCRLAKKQVYRNLTLYPVLFPIVLEPYYLTLEQAIGTGALVVTEVDASGNVNRLKPKLSDCRACRRYKEDGLPL